MEFTEGTRVGDFLIEGTLGLGPMSVVYLGRNLRSDTLHAIKVPAGLDDIGRQRLHWLARSQDAILHPNLVSITGSLETDDALGLVMEYVEGPALAALMSAGRSPLSQVDALARGILAGAAAGHRRGLLHLNLNPDNVLLTLEGDQVTPRITDFGLYSADAVPRGGSPGYTAPEQIRGGARVDARADVFALGAVLYELLTGQRAFAGDSEQAVLEATCAGRYPAPSDRGVPGRMLSAIQGALAVDREERFPDASALLEAWVGGTPAPSPTWGPEHIYHLFGEQPSWPEPEGSGFPLSDTLLPESVRGPQAPILPLDPGLESQRREEPWPWLVPAGVGVTGALLAVLFSLTGECAPPPAPPPPLVEQLQPGLRDLWMAPNARVSGRAALINPSRWDPTLTQAVVERVEALAGSPSLERALELHRDSYGALVLRLRQASMPEALAAAVLVDGGYTELDADRRLTRMAQTWSDPALRSSGAAVQLTAAAHLGEDVSGAFQRWSAFHPAEHHPHFFGENMTCPANPISSRCGGALRSGSQRFAPEVLATHLVATCYYAANFGGRVPFDAWTGYLDGYCAALQRRPRGPEL